MTRMGIIEAPGTGGPEAKAGVRDRRIMIVQYAGDFRAAYTQLQADGGEVYHGHRYVFEQLERMRESFGEVAIVCCLSPEAYHETLPNGVTVIGARTHPRRGIARLRRLMAEWNPTDLIVLGALTGVLHWGTRTGRRVTCQLADSFEINPLIRYLKFGRLAHTLNDPRVGWVTNHGTNACASLVRLGVDPAKIVAWDWPHSRHPSENPPRSGFAGGEATLLYVGTVQPKKGVGDVIAAVAKLRAAGRAVRLKVVGSGRIDEFRAMAHSLGVEDGVEFLGAVPNTLVFEMMKSVTAVVVPSRHDYPEGLPLTIYESLCARTPLIASDHPMFRGHLVDRRTAMVFPAKDAEALAASIVALLDDPDLYEALSRNSEAVWESIQNPVKWGETLYRWLSDTPEDREWFDAHRLGGAGTPS